MVKIVLLKWTVKDIVEVIEGCVLNKFDFILFIEGKRGLGKSTLAYKIALRLKNRGVVKFNPETNLVYSREDTIRLLATKKKHVILSDELVNVAYNRDFFEQDQKTLLKGLNMYRDSSNVFIGCIPAFGDLDTQIKRLCKIRITVTKRGVALVQVPKRGIFTPDPWDTQENIKRELKKRKGYGKLTTVKGVLLFNDLTEEQQRYYQHLKELKRGQVFQADLSDPSLKNTDTALFDRVYNLIINGHLTKDGLETICRVQDKTISSFRDRLNKKLREDPDQNETLQSYLDIAELKHTKKKKPSNLPVFKAPKIIKQHS